MNPRAAPTLGALIVTLTVTSAVTARAHVVSDRELAVVAKMPAGFVPRTFAGLAPDSGGFVRPNRADAWRGVEYQRGALLLLIDAAARGDTARAERCWSALERAFAYQVAEGGFRSGAPVPGAGARPAGDASAASAEGAGASPTGAGDADAVWIGATCRALIAVMNSPLQNRFRWRYALLKPKLQRAVDAFERGHESYRQRHARRPAMLLAAAAALLLADGIYHEERFGTAGQRALVDGLALQRGDGQLAADRTASSAEHALGLGALQSIVIYFPSPTLERAADRATRWLARRRGAKSSPGRVNPLDAVLIPGEAAFVLRYAAIRPPPPAGATPH